MSPSVEGLCDSKGVVHDNYRDYVADLIDRINRFCAPNELIRQATTESNDPNIELATAFFDMVRIEWTLNDAAVVTHAASLPAQLPESWIDFLCRFGEFNVLQDQPLPEGKVNLLFYKPNKMGKTIGGNTSHDQRGFELFMESMSSRYDGLKRLSQSTRNQIIKDFAG